MLSIECSFASGDTTCRATLYLPAATNTSQLPCIVLGHGFGGVRSMLLPYAKAFVAQGWAAMSFDYRNFGESGGTERQVLRVPQQLEDWRAAIAHIRTMEQIDPKRIALWGSSLGGAHVLSIAAKDHSIRAVVAQVPHISGWAAARAAGFIHGLRIARFVVTDLLGNWFFGRRNYLPLVGTQGSIMVGDDCDGFLKSFTHLAPGTRLDVAAASVLSIARYFPVWTMHNIRSPLLIIVANRDGTTPAKDSVSAAHRCKHSELVQFNCGHFDVYLEPLLSQALDAQITFLTRQL